MLANRRLANEETFPLTNIIVIIALQEQAMKKTPFTITTPPRTSAFPFPGKRLHAISQKGTSHE